MQNKIKKILSVFLATLMVLSIVPVTQLMPTAKAVTREYYFPIRNGSLAYLFGYTDKYAGNHYGIDIHSGGDDTVYAAYGGTVVFARWWGDGGNTVQIHQDDGTYAYYMHMASLNVSAGQYVKMGTPLGVMGSTGNSTGKHLHFEVRTKSNYTNDYEQAINVNPTSYENAQLVKAKASAYYGDCSKSNKGYGEVRYKLEICSHLYGSNYLCKNCNAVDPSKITTMSDTAYIVVSDNPICRIAPYNTFNDNTVRVKKDDIVTVTGKMTNESNKLWYRLSNGKWIYSEHIKPYSVTYTDIADGCYRLKNVYTQKYLIVDSGDGSNGKNVSVWPLVESATEEQWNLVEDSLGFKIHTALSSGRVLNSYGTTVKAGNNVNIWDFIAGDATQRWKFQKVSGGYVIRNVSVPSCVLTVVDGYNACVDTFRSGDTTQLWIIEPVTGCSHSYVSKIIKTATCTNIGIIIYTCTKCSHSYGETIAKIAHSYTSSVTTQPTCTTAGVKTYICTKCGNSYTESISTSHNYISNVTTPDCTNGGYTTYTCTSCNNSYTSDYVTATGHNYTSASCTVPATCTVCGITSGNKLGHTYTNNCDASCDRCGDTRTTTHSYTAATCTKPKTCKLCGVTSGNKLGHTYTNDCDNTCNRCGANRTATAHTYKTTTTKATLTANGSIKTVCSDCGAVKSNKVIYAPKTFTLSTAAYTYNGNVRTPTVTVKDSTGNILKKGTDYTVTYATGRKNPGTYKVTVKMIGNYTGTKTLSFKIKPIDISTCKVKLSATNYTFNGKVKTPTVTVTNAYGTKLTKDKHYTVTYASGRKNAGTYKVTVKMIGNYTGTKTLSFKIKPIDISTCKVKLSATSLTYNGKVRTPSVTVTNAYGTKLTKDKHYTVTYASGRKNAGTYKVTVKMIGNYTGTKTLSFKIKPVDISKCKVKLSATNLTYNGKVRTPSVTVTNPSGVKLTKDTHYAVSYSKGRKNVGTYKVTVTMFGNYMGTKTLTFKITPPKTTISKLSAGAKKITVNLTKKTTQVTGYQIQYSTSKDFTNAKTKTLTSYSTVKTTLTGLTANKTYYVRVRTYKTVNNVKYYSGWSQYKYVKTK